MSADAVYKVYVTKRYGYTFEDMEKVYSGKSEDDADDVADRYYEKGYCVEVWYGDGHDDQPIRLI